MNSNQEVLSQLLAKKAGIPVSKAENLLAQVFDVITDELAKGNSVTCRGRFSLVIQRARPRKGRDISKNTWVLVPERNVVKFVSSKYLDSKLLEQK